MPHALVNSVLCCVQYRFALLFKQQLHRGLHVRESLHLAQIIQLKGIKNQKEKKVCISHSEGSKLSARFP